jgi:heme iron utilization protein
MSVENLLLARQLLKQQDLAVLATTSAEVAHYPYGSVVPYTLNQAGEPLILISNLAQHTRNIQQNTKVSLTIFDPQTGDPLANPRLTWLADAVKLASDSEIAAAKARYLRYFPAASRYFELGGFYLYRLQLYQAHYIGGFGKIFWLGAELQQANPLATVESDIVTHMNVEHQAALHDYCRAFWQQNAAQVQMIGIDCEGFDLLVDSRKRRLTFATPVNTADEARLALVQLVKEARRQLNNDTT